MTKRPARSLYSLCPGPRDCQICGAKGKRGCRPSRPLCAEMAKVNERYNVCCCDGYPFPHRRGGGACEHNARGPERQWRRYLGAERFEELAAAGDGDG